MYGTNGPTGAALVVVGVVVVVPVVVVEPEVVGAVVVAPDVVGAVIVVSVVPVELEVVGAVVVAPVPDPVVTVDVDPVDVVSVDDELELVVMIGGMSPMAPETSRPSAKSAVTPTAILSRRV
jgi:hypothetical protein